jgi:Xaa-Pro aminopeptidase
MPASPRAGLVSGARDRERGSSRADGALRGRWAAIWHAMEREGIESLVLYGRGEISQYGNFQFITGVFPEGKGSYAVLRLGQEPIHIVVTEAESRGVTSQRADANVELSAETTWRHRMRTVADYAKGVSGGVGVCSGTEGSLPVADYHILQDLLGESLARDCTQLVEGVRTTYQAGLRDGLLRASQIAERSLRVLQRDFRVGMSELECTGRIEMVLRSSGARSSIVQVNVNEFVGRLPSAREVRLGDVVSVFSELADPEGYWTELGAIFAVGDIDSRKQRAARQCLEVLKQAPQLLESGNSAGHVAKELIARIRAGGGELSVGLGHGVAIDEGPPILSSAETRIITDQHAMAVHPSLSFPSEGVAVAAANTYIWSNGRVTPVSDYPHHLHRLSAGA